MKRLAAMAVIALVLGGTAAPAFADDETVHGTITLLDSGGDFSLFTKRCFGEGGYDDIESGAQVIAKDGDGHTIGIGHLGRGVGKGKAATLYTRCVFKFTLKVPDDEKFYEFKIGGRGGPTYSNKQMQKNDWKVELSLG